MSFSSSASSVDEEVDFDGLDDVTDDFERCHLNRQSSYHGNNETNGNMSVGVNLYNTNDYSDLPSILTVTGVPEFVFNNEAYRNEFESLFRQFEPMPDFYYLKSFRRARVVYKSPNSAIHARIQMHERNFYGSNIKCYFAQMPEMNDASSSYLLPPKPDKQLLISPPSSPPVGWEPITESEPVINYDLLAAIANLTPGESYEIHAASNHYPGIVVHICEDPEGFRSRPRMPISETKCIYNA